MGQSLQAGDIGFSTIAGGVGGLITMGQAMLGDGCRFTHAFMVLDDGMGIEAMPGGARIVSIEDRYGPGYAYAHLPLTESQRMQITPIAHDLAGRPYSFADYLALSAVHFGIKLPFIRRYVTDSGHMICSQLVDYLLCEVDHHLFDDGRLPQDVTPGDLYYVTDPRVVV